MDVSEHQPGEGLIVVINSDAGRVRAIGPAALRSGVQRAAPPQLRRIMTTDRYDLRPTLQAVAALKPQAVAIIGGDGSAHCALEVLTPSGIAVAPLPGGTMNRLPARVFGAASFAQSVAALSDSAPRSLSGGRVGDYRFYVAAGFGAWMQMQRLRERLRKPKGLSGLKAILRMAPRQFADRIQWSIPDAPPLSHSTLLVGVGRLDSAFGFGRDRHAPSAFEAAGADIANWRDLTLVAGAAVLRRWRRVRHVTSLTTRTLQIVSNHDGTPALFDGEFRMLGRSHTVIYEPDCGLVFGPARWRTPY